MWATDLGDPDSGFVLIITFKLFLKDYSLTCTL